MVMKFECPIFYSHRLTETIAISVVLTIALMLLISSTNSSDIAFSKKNSKNVMNEVVSPSLPKPPDPMPPKPTPPDPLPDPPVPPSPMPDPPVPM